MTGRAGFRIARWVGGLLFLAGLASVVDAENWPQYRGPGARGTSAMAAPESWNVERGENVRWQTPIPGLGHAAPIVWEGRVYLATALRPGVKAEVKTGVFGDGASLAEKEPHQWRLVCVELSSGRILWDRLGHESIPSQPRHTKASQCNSTPATDGKCLVAMFGSEGLFAFDLEGKLLWRRELGKMDAGPWDAPDLRWGFASSPVIHDGRVFVQCDVLSEQYLADFALADGREVWRTRRNEVANWCTPTVAPEQGLIVLNGWKELGGYDLQTGARRWWLSGGGDIPVPAPLVSEGLAFFTSAHGKYRPLRAVRLEAQGDITPPRVEDTNAAVVWSHPRLGSYLQTPIQVGTNLWSCDWQGVLTCVEARTGRLHYNERLGQGGQAFTASPVAARDRIYIVSEEGQVFVIAAKPEFQVVATNRLGGNCLASPAVVSGTLLFRTTESLIAIGSKGANDRR